MAQKKAEAKKREEADKSIDVSVYVLTYMYCTPLYRAPTFQQYCAQYIRGRC